MKDDHSKRRGFVTTYGEWLWDNDLQKYRLVRREGYEYDGPWALAHTNANFVQQNWRFRNDDGSLSTATWAAAEDTVANNDEFSAGDKFRIRFNLGVDNSADSNNSGTPTLQYNLDGAGWNNVPTTAGADGIAFAASGTVGDGSNEATQRLSTISGSTYQSGWMEFDSNGSQTSRTYVDDYTEYEYCLALSAGTSGNTYQLRLLDPTGNVPDVEPSVTASLTVTAVPLTASGTPNAPTTTASGTAKLAPFVWLNTSASLSGATKMTVTSFNQAGTSITFSDPSGAPTGSNLWLGVENRNNNEVGWIQVTVNAAGTSASGTPTVTATTASGTARLVLEASGTPSTAVTTASGTAGNLLQASGTPSTAETTAAGFAGNLLEASGTPSTAETTASGTATASTPPLTASGNVTAPTTTASGTAGNLLQASGTPSTAEVTASGTAGNLLSASGTPDAPTTTASGTATLGPLVAAGTPDAPTTTASGTATKSALPPLVASGTPTTAEATASGTAGNLLTASGTPTAAQTTASGAAATLLTASGTPTAAATTASGVAKLGPLAYLNTSPTLAGATLLTVTSWNQAGTSLTFTDPVGPPTGAGLWFGIENRNNGDVGWIEVTVTAAGTSASGTPTFEVTTASGTATLGPLTASGTPTAPATTASGVAGLAGNKSATGNATTAVTTAAGTATLGPLTASGTPTTEATTASGTAALGALTASGTPSTDAVTAAGTATLGPLAYLNTSPTLVGATLLTVTDWNQAGTSLTFTDPAGPPVGSGLWFGIENRNNGDVGWIEVTVTSAAAKTASGTPSTAPATASGTALNRRTLAASGTPSAPQATASGVGAGPVGGIDVGSAFDEYGEIDKQIRKRRRAQEEKAILAAAMQLLEEIE